MKKQIKKAVSQIIPTVKETAKKEKKNLVLWLIWGQLVIISIILCFIAYNLNKNTSNNSDTIQATLELQKNLNNRLDLDYDYETSDNPEKILAVYRSMEKPSKFNTTVLKFISFTEKRFKIYKPTEITHNGKTTILEGTNNGLLAKMLKSAKHTFTPKTVDCSAYLTKLTSNIAEERYRQILAWQNWKKQQREKELALALQNITPQGLLGTL